MRTGLRQIGLALVLIASVLGTGCSEPPAQPQAPAFAEAPPPPPMTPTAAPPAFEFAPPSGTASGTCSATGDSRCDAPVEAAATDTGKAAATDSAPEAIPEPDRSCQVDADCAVKDVGNCCGYFPACVNTQAQTFPERVKAACSAQGLSSICGFEDISACACIEGRCAAAAGGAQLQ
jgi:hypothetical protein